MRGRMMGAIGWTILLALSLAVSGCATQHPFITWNRPGATQEQYHADEAACRLYVNQYVTMSGASPFARDDLAWHVNYDCMQAKGWVEG